MANNLKFCSVPHSITDDIVVQVWSAGGEKLLGVLYPTPDGVKFVSKYITNHPLIVAIDPDEPPAILISLEKRLL